MFSETAWNEGLWLWVVIDILAVVVLGLAIFYGTRMWRSRPNDPIVQRQSDEATRRLYRHGDDRPR
jgi:hypothetical protein